MRAGASRLSARLRESEGVCGEFTMRRRRAASLGLAASAAVLFITATLKIGTLFEGPTFLQLNDAVLGISLRSSMWLALSIELVLLVFFFFSRSIVVCSSLFLSFSISGLVYHWQRVTHEQLYCACLGNLGSWIGLDRNGAATLAFCLLLFILVTSTSALFLALSEHGFVLQQNHYNDAARRSVTGS